MLKIVRDLFRYNREFAVGAIITVVIVGLAILSAFSPYSPIDIYVVPPDVPPSRAYPMGTTSRGQDTFWQLTFAIRNTLLFGFAVALISRVLSLLIGLLAGYKGGLVDRVLMSVNDTFIVIPLFPLLILFYFVMREYMTWALLALVMAFLGWAYDARLIRSIMMSLKTREFTRTSVFSGMRTWEILVQEHLPYVLPIVFSTTLNNINWSIGLEVTLSVLGFTDINTPDHRHHDFLGQPAQRHGLGRLVVVRVPDAGDHAHLHRPVSARRVDERVHRPAKPPQPHGRRCRLSDGGADPFGAQPARLLPDEVFRHHARGEGGRRHHARCQAQRDLRSCRRIELRQDQLHQDHRRCQPAAAQRAWAARSATASSTATSSS